MVSVKKIMTKNPISVEMSTTAREVAEIMKSKKSRKPPCSSGRQDCWDNYRD